MADSEESNVQIAIPPADQSHDQTPPPVPPSHAAPSPDSNNSFDLKGCAMRDEWSVKVENFVRHNPHSLRIPLNERGDRALHVAVDASSTTFVKELVKFMRPEDQLIQNNDDNIPLHLAISTCQKKMAELLLSKEAVDKMADKVIKQLLLMAIENDMFDVAMELYKKYSAWLTTIPGREYGEKSFTAQALCKLGEKKFSESSYMKLERNYKDLFMELWNQAVKLGERETQWLSAELWKVLTDLSKSRNTWARRWLLDEHGALVMKIKEPTTEKNLLHLFVEYRWPDTFLECRLPDEKILLRKVDGKGNNILHLAAQLESSSPSYNQVERDLRYFKGVKRRLPLELSRMKNNDGKRPVEVFYYEHKNLSEENKRAAKEITKSGMLVATIVATVAFTAALTVPGDKFIIFFLTNVVALFTSCTSIFSFWSNFINSRLVESEFVLVLYPSLTFGPVLLTISVAAMIMAFIAASFLIFDHTNKWVSYLVVSMGAPPLYVFLCLQFSDKVILYHLFYIKRYRVSKLE